MAERDAGGNGVTADGHTPPPGNADVSSAALEPHLTANRENYAAAKPPLVCDAPSAPLTDGVGSVLDREVNCPLAGYAGPGFHNWPGSADVLVGEYETGDSHPKKKTFGETFGAATVAGYVGPGFHNWPSGHIPQDTAPKPLLRIRSPAKKTFGEAFGAATGVSDPRLQKIRIRNDYAGKLTS